MGEAWVGASNKTQRLPCSGLSVSQLTASERLSPPESHNIGQLSKWSSDQSNEHGSRGNDLRLGF